jgi:N-acetylmuramoyl-L-alanine amidase
MIIRNHRLVDHWFGKSKDVGGPLTELRFVVLHYTAGGDGASSRDYMMLSPTAKMERIGASQKVYASAHVVVDRDGTVWQIVPFNLKARHAGESRWKGLTSLNRYSVGIEIANYGWLDRYADGTYGRGDTPRFNPDQVIVGPMPGGTEIKGWEPYPAAQLDAAERVTRSLLAKYPSITEVIRHQDISPGRKFDPGPAFPFQRFRNLVDNRGFGALEGERAVNEAPTERYEAITSLNIRGGPGTENEMLDVSPVPRGTELVKIREHGDWYLVHLARDEQVMGWVHSWYLRLLGAPATLSQPIDQTLVLPRPGSNPQADRQAMLAVIDDPATTVLVVRGDHPGIEDFVREAEPTLGVSPVRRLVWVKDAQLLEPSEISSWFADEDRWVAVTMSSSDRPVTRLEVDDGTRLLIDRAFRDAERDR